MPTGVVKKWNGDRGFGFIAPDDGSEEVFVHFKCLQDGNDYLTEGEAVQYDEEFDQMKGKMRAISCTGGYNGGEWTPQPRKGGVAKAARVSLHMAWAGRVAAGNMVDMATTATVGTEGKATIAPQTMVKDIMATTATIVPQTMVKEATVGTEGMAI
eukprot:CAMPEP_0172814210 /NCGR_PEP_ID=MMETSP1075-20121228/11117_1 /TAXON_ID=2916 /ORGANISM="Ceratium fusus, Strain PA161109" /LENGTH=155 /DNA_ID=CAMNT_0013653997 /DNA_START=64 /DNA_END=529 /DNA_ORIENTATION=+